MEEYEALDTFAQDGAKVVWLDKDRKDEANDLTPQEATRRGRVL